ncbi:MAG: response regulator [Coleofasciculus sp. Co-bin14]|nr:response regulator [Coleofasciculus sp. Co-bin14]
MLTETITILLVEDNSKDSCIVRELLQDIEAVQFRLIHVTRLADALTELTAKTSIALEKQDAIQQDALRLRNVSINTAASQELAAASLHVPYKHSNASQGWACSSKNATRTLGWTSSRVANKRQAQHTNAPAFISLQRSGEGKACSVILLDLSLPDTQGLDAVKQVHRAAPNIPIVVMSSLSDEAIALQSLQEGAQDYLIKGHVDTQLLVRSIRYAIEQQQLQQRLQHVEAELQRQNTQQQLVQERTQQLAQEKARLEVMVNSIQEGICEVKPDAQVLTERKRTKEELRRYDRLLAGFTDAMRQLLLATDYQEAMRRSLIVLGIATHVDRVYIFENHVDQNTGEQLTSERFKWAADGIAIQDNPKLQNLSYTVTLPRWYKNLAVGQPIKGLVRDFPVVERELLEQENIRSILVVPVITEGKFWGFIGFADCQSDRQWTDHEESILSVTAGSIGSIIVRQQTEEALRESETKFRTLYESTSAAVFLLDENGILDANSAALQMFGYTEREQLCGKRNSDLSPPVQPNHQSSLSLANEYIATAIREGSCRFDWIYRKQNGKDFPAEVTLTLIELGNRKVLQALIYDMAERTATETQLVTAKEAAEAGSRAKSEFLATISHELRTPLNAVLGLSQLMRQELFGSLNEKQKKYITCIQNSGEHLLALINDILDLSKVEAGKEQLNFVPLDIQDLCEYCLTTVQEQANDQGLKLTLDIDSHARICIADERRCKQMLLNLLSNAVKFTPVGEVSLIVRKLPEGLSFSVKDTGIGIPADKLPLLFEPFRQLDSGLNRRFPGTGLGLALTRSLAKLHDGNVTVESTLGEGSEFTLWLPDWPSEELLLASSSQDLEQTGGLSCPLGTKARILIVENDERSALVLKDYLQVIGHRVQHLMNGANFLEAVHSFKPNLILMDVQLPGEFTGFDLLAELRQDPNTKDLKVVMVTAMAMAGDRERCLKAGADDYLSKPIGIAQLEVILMRHL